MPSGPRGRDAATVLAVVLTVVLAFAWLRSSGDGAPSVPVGLPAAAPAAAVVQPAGSAGLGQGAEGDGAGEVGGVGGGERDGGAAAAGRGGERSRGAAANGRRGDTRRPVSARRSRRADVDRASGGEDAHARRQAGTRTLRRHDQPAAAPGPRPGGGAVGGPPPAAVAPASPQPDSPEFAIG